MENQILENGSYEEVLNYLNSVDDLDGMMLAGLQEQEPVIKVISGNMEIEYAYNDFLRIFDTQGLEGLV